MEPRKFSSSFPFAIRARLSTEDSGSDASSIVAGDSSGDSSGGEEAEEDDNGGSLGRYFVPIARVTGDEEDDDVVVFDDDEWGNPRVADERLVVDEGLYGGEEEDGDLGVDEWGKPRVADERLVVERSDLAVVDEGFGGEEKDGDLGVKGSVIAVQEKGYFEEAVSIDDDEWGNPNLAEERLVVERLNSAVDESFGRGVFSGREEKDGDMGVKGSVNVVEERMAVSIDCDEWGNCKLAAERLAVERLNSAVDEGFGGGGFSGREEKDGDMGVKCSVIVLDDDAGAVEVGLGLNDVKVEVDGSNLVHDVEEDLDSGAVVYEQIGAVRCRDVELFELSTVDSEKNNLDGDVDSTQNSAMEVELRAEFEAGHLVIPAVEDNPSEIVNVEDFGAVTSRKRLNEDAEEEIGVFGDKEEEVRGLIYSKIGFFDEKMLEASEAEANPTESKRFEATKLKLIHDSKSFDNIEKDEDLYRSVDSEKPKHFTGELHVLTDSLNVHGNDSPSTDVSTETTMVYLDNVNERNDESRVEEISIAENYSIGEFSSDNFSPFYCCEKEMESRFDSFYFSLDEDSVEEDEHVIPEWPAMADRSENSGFFKHILKEMEEDSSSSQTYSHILDVQTISNSDQEGETYKNSDAKEIFDTCALAALLKDGGSSGKVALFTYQDTSFMNVMDDEERMLCSRVEQLRAKYLRLVDKLRHSPNDALPDHVLRQIGLIDLVRRGRGISEDFNLKTAKKVIFQHDEGKHDFILSCTILVLGKTGVGKSAIINSIFGEKRSIPSCNHFSEGDFWTG